MYRCILVPLDGTAFGEQALPHAVAIASRTDAVLHLAHVHLPPIIPSGAETAALPPVWIEMSWDEKKRYLDGVAARIADESSVRVETRVMEGSVASALERHAVKCGVGLIVMSTHGHVGLSRLWHHGVADQLARDLPLPVLLVRSGEPPSSAPVLRSVDITNVLILLDGSADSELVIEHAAALGKPFAARFTLVRVTPEGSRRTNGREGSGSGELERTAFQTVTAARQYLNGLAERLRSRGLDVATELLAGEDTAAAVLGHIRAAEADSVRRVDIVAIESPERGAVSRLLFRGTADELIREAPVPVLLFQAPRAVPVPSAMRPGLVGSG